MSSHSSYQLYIVHIVALNPKQSLPYLDHLEKAHNLEIQEQESQVLNDLKRHVQVTCQDKV